jgi:hypothetical protein
MAEDVVKEKAKRAKKKTVEESADEGVPAPLIDAETVQTGVGLCFFCLLPYYCL